MVERHSFVVRRWHRLVVGMAVVTGACVCGVAARTVDSRAQQPVTNGAIAGIVVDGLTELPLAHVLVRLADTGVSVTTQADGRFELTSIPPGRHTMTVSVVGYALMRRRVTLVAGSRLEFTVALTPGSGTYEERVDVVAPLVDAHDPGTAADQTISAVELQDLRDMVADDPLRAAQAMPGVVASTDFSAEFAARGSGPGHTNVVLDGVPAAAVLLHSIDGLDYSASISRISTDIVARASLQLGSYPQRYGDRLGSQLEFTSREGARDGVHLRAMASSIAAGAVAEGPLPGKRGSWLVDLRQSYLDWAIRTFREDSTSWLGFSDGFAKAVYDVTPANQVWLTALAGRSHYEEKLKNPGASSIRDSYNHGGMVILGWRSSGASWVLTHRLFTSTNGFRNTREDGEELGWGRQENAGYRGDFSRVWSPHLTMDIGAHVQRAGEHQHLWALNWRMPPTRTATEDYGATVTMGGGFAQLRWQPATSTLVNAGARLDTSSANHATTVSPWLQVEQHAPFGLTFHAGSGVYHQTPSFAQIFGLHGGGQDLDPQRAWHADVGVEQTLGAHTRWQVAVFNRDERQVAWASGLETRSWKSLVKYNARALYQSRLEGNARGVEVVLQRRDPNGLSGWLAYAYERSRYTDPATGESFVGDYDQRHAVNAYGSLRLWTRTTLIAKCRLGSGLPLRGYYQATGQTDEDGLPVFVPGPARNAASLPRYARLDLRVNHALHFSTRRLTLFAEVFNVLDRKNIGSAGGRWVQTLLPFIPAGGFLLEF
jgi:hypothetical protein